MLDLISQPIGLFIVALGIGFLLPLLYRASPSFASNIFLTALAYMAGLSAYYGWSFYTGELTSLNIQTAGINEPFAINLRYGFAEATVACAVNISALLAGWHYLYRLRESASSLLIFLIMIMGINGMIMTRDLFNLFIFIEISSIATYALIGLEREGNTLVAGVKYIMATSIASAFFLLGTMFIYYQTGTLNIDDIIAHRNNITGPIGLVASVFLFGSLLIELKPYPANGWGLDVYETTPGGVASVISVGISAGVLFALYKVMPLLGNMVEILLWVGGITFLLSNLIGLKQEKAKRLLGYSSIGQIGLLIMAMAMLNSWQANGMIAIVGGLFINHLFAKAGLFWLADYVKGERLRDWRSLTKHTSSVVLLVVLLAALVGLPPFPGFWAKWQLVMLSASHGAWGWIALILVGSLLEASYLYRWFTQASAGDEAEAPLQKPQSQLLLVGVAATALAVVGYWMASELISASIEHLYLPLLAGFVMFMFDRLSGRIKTLLMLVVVGYGGWLLTGHLQGLAMGFAILLVGGGMLLSIASLHNTATRPGYFPLLTVLLLSLASIVSADNTLSFFYGWELMTLSSYLLISSGREGKWPSLQYLLFSLGSAYFLMSGFAVSYADSGSMLLSDLGNTPNYAWAFGLMAVGFLIKIAGFGAHIWLPEAYAEADDDLTPILSAVLSKASIFGLLVIGGHFIGQVQQQFDVSYLLGWMGILTALFGALMAAFQEDIKKLVAYSSMGQVGYIVTGIAIMSHMGWVSALYTTINHFMFKGILFLAVAGVILRTQERMMYRMGGLIKNMPVTFFTSMIAVIAMSGVPPLTGFGGKWMLFNALMDKGWFWIAAVAFFSSAVGFLYMFRYLQTVFLGQRKLEHRELKEAPLCILLPQVVLVLAILAFSAWPQFILLPLSDAITPIVGGSLIWDGTALVSNLGRWDAPLIMVVVGLVWMVPLILLLLVSRTIHIQKVEQFNIVYAAERPSRPEHTHYAWNFFAHYRRAIGFLVEPRATAFWSTMNEWSHSLAASTRVFYTGNGQTYALYVLIYFIAIFIIAGGLS